MNKEMMKQKNNLLKIRKALKSYTFLSSSMVLALCFNSMASNSSIVNIVESSEILNDSLDNESMSSLENINPIILGEPNFDFNSLNEDIVLSDYIYIPENMTEIPDFELQSPYMADLPGWESEEERLAREEEERKQEEERLEEQKRLEEEKRLEEQKRLEEEKRLEEQKAFEEMVHNFMFEHYGLSEEDYNALITSIISTSQENGLGFHDAFAVENLFYEMSLVSNEEKLSAILEKYQVTYDEFSLFAAVMIGEAKGLGTSYADAYATTNCVFNRLRSAQCIEDYGKTIYEQVTAPYQFEVYYENLYQPFINDCESIGYQAILDMLYFEVPMHNYLNFVAHDPKKVGNDTKRQFVSQGNRFYNVIQDEVISLALVKTEE